MAFHFQKYRRAFRHGGIVIDDQDAQSHPSAKAILKLTRCLRVTDQGQADRKCGTLARPGAGCGDLAAMQFHQILDQGEADTETALGSVKRAFALAEQVEHPGQQFLRHAQAIVPHHNLQPALARIGIQGDVAAALGVLGGVIQQIDQYLKQPRGVSLQRNRLGRDLRKELMPHGLHQRVGGFDGMSNQYLQVDRLDAQIDLAAHDARDIQQIVHQAAQVGHLPFDDFLRPAHARLIQLQTAEDMGGIADRRQRVSQFMRQHGEEFILAPVGVEQVEFGLLHAGDIGHDAQHAGAGSILGIVEAAASTHPVNRFIRPDDAKLCRVVLLFRHAAAQSHLYLGEVRRVHAFGPGLVAGRHLILLIAQNFVVAARPDYFAAGEIPVPGAGAADFGGQLQARFAFAQCLFGQFDVRDVLGYSEAAEQLSLLAELQFRLFLHPFDLAIHHQSVLDVIGFAAQTGLPHHVHIDAVFRMNAAYECFVSQRSALGDAEDAMVFWRPGQLVESNVQPPTADTADGLGSIQVGVALAQRPLNPPAGGHVMQYQHGARRLAVGFQRGVGGSDMDRAAVLAEKDRFMVTDHLAGVIDLAQGAGMHGIRLAVCLAVVDHVVQMPPHQFVFRVAEDAPSLRVHEGHSTLCVVDEDRIGCLVGDALVEVKLITQRVFRALAVGDVFPGR